MRRSTRAADTARGLGILAARSVPILMIGGSRSSGVSVSAAMPGSFAIERRHSQIPPVASVPTETRHLSRRGV